MSSVASRFESWLRRRHPPGNRALRLVRRRLYILPTGFGALFGLLLVVLFLWSVNYSNSLGFVLTFWLAGTALVSMWRCHNNLLDLQLTPLGARPVFAGEQACFGLLLDSDDSAPRYDIALRTSRTPLVYADVTATGRRVDLALPAPERGWLRPGRIRIQTRYPLDLFRAWSWVEFDQACLVYPRPDGERPLPAPQADQGLGESGLQQGTGDDFTGLRNYQNGDAPRHIAWKASSRSEQLLVKRFTGTAPPELWLDWSDLNPLAEEARLSQLCRWVLEADTRGYRYGLRLPGRTIDPDLGVPQRMACLKALALHGLADPV